MSLVFNMLSRFVVGLSRFASSKEQVSFNFMAAVTVAVILEPKKVHHRFHFPPFICHEAVRPDAMVIGF